jgi:hypothetical protein
MLSDMIGSSVLIYKDKHEESSVCLNYSILRNNGLPGVLEGLGI